MKKITFLLSRPRTASFPAVLFNSGRDPAHAPVRSWRGRTRIVAWPLQVFRPLEPRALARVGSIFVCLLLMCGTVFAATAEETRGTEEDKRKSLAPTEAQQHPAAPARESGLNKEKYAFLEEVYNKKVSSLNDACRALGIMLGKEEQFVQENFFPPSMKAPFHLQEPLRKGVVAYMLCKALHIKGGLWLRLLGVNQRYALRELVYEGIMFSGNVQDLMSGKELISTLTQAADYLTGFHER